MLGSDSIARVMSAEPYGFSFGASTTVVTHGKLEMYSKAAKPLWAPSCVRMKRAAATVIPASPGC